MKRTALDKFLEYQEQLNNVTKEITLEQIEEALDIVEKEAPNSNIHKRLFMLYLTKKFKKWD